MLYLVFFFFLHFAPPYIYRGDADVTGRSAGDPDVRGRRHVPGGPQRGQRPSGVEDGAPSPDRHVRTLSQREGHAVQGESEPALAQLFACFFFVGEAFGAFCWLLVLWLFGSDSSSVATGAAAAAV